MLDCQSKRLPTDAVALVKVSVASLHRSRAGYAVSHVRCCAMAAAEVKRQAVQIGVRVQPLHKHFGAEIQGIDLTQSLSQQQQGFLVAALEQYDALLFRDRQLRPADQQRTVQCFPHDEHAVKEQQWANAFMQLRPPEAPLVAVRPNNIALKDHYGLTTDEFARGNCNGAISQTHVWHMDVSDSPQMPEVISLYSHTTPEAGSDTVFAHTPSFLESLSEDELKHLESLQVSSLRQVLPVRLAFGWKLNYEGTLRLDDVDGKLAEAEAAGELRQPTWMPLVARHPRTGRKALLLAPYLVYKIRSTDGDLSPRASREFAQQLMERASSPDHRYSHAWRDNDFLLWANRSFIHTGTPQDNYQDQARLFHIIWLNSRDSIQPANPAMAMAA